MTLFRVLSDRRLRMIRRKRAMEQGRHSSPSERPLPPDLRGVRRQWPYSVPVDIQTLRGARSVGEERDRQTLVAPEEHRARDGRRPKPIAQVVESRVEIRGPSSIEGQCQLDGTVVI